MTRATVIKSHNPENIGKIVEILERADFTDAPIGGRDERFGVVWERGSRETVWICRTLGGPFLFKEGLTFASVVTNTGYFADSQLLPFPDEEDCYEELIDYVDTDEKKLVAKGKAEAFLQSLREQSGKDE